MKTRRAPKVKPPNPKKPNFMRERPDIPVRKSSMAPMVKKRLSK